jgi:predicted DNA binding CopG/RHH family protein
MKKSQELSVPDWRVARKGRDIRKRKAVGRPIDFSDIPELSEKQLSVMRRVGRPTLGDRPRKLIAIRLDPKVLDWVKETAAKRGLPYQSFINDILAKEMKRAN